MDDIISSYIDTKYSEEMAAVIYRALGLFNVFGLSSPTVFLIDAIHMSQEEHPEVIMDTITNIIDNGLDQLFLAHRITTSDNAVIPDKVNILESIYAFQYQESYKVFKTLLENTDVQARDRFINVISVISGTDPSNFEDLIDEVYDGTVDRMQEFLDSMIQEEESTQDFEMLKKVRNNLLIYSKAFGKPTIAINLEELDFQYGLSFDTYFDLVQNEVIDTEDLESTTFGLLWLALISADGVDNPQKLLNEKMDSFFDTIMDINRFNAMLSKALGRFQDFKGNAK